MRPALRTTPGSQYRMLRCSSAGRDLLVNPCTTHWLLAEGCAAARVLPYMVETLVATPARAISRVDRRRLVHHPSR